MSGGGRPIDLERLFRKQANLYRLHEHIDGIVARGPVGPRFVLTENLIQKIHAVAMDGLLEAPGQYRDQPVGITNTTHQCPPWSDVEVHMKNLVKYVNENWAARDLIHLAAFAMWRMCWIHPFLNGNGRTARGVSYLILCAHYGQLLPPKNSVIEQIMRDKAPYYAALQAVDAAYQSTSDPRVCCSPLEQLLGALLKEQIRANLA